MDSGFGPPPPCLIPGSGTCPATRPHDQSDGPSWPADLFGMAGRELLDSLKLPERWQTNLVESLALVDDPSTRIDAVEQEPRTLGADHPSMRLLMTVPGVGWVLAYTIASEIGDISRFASPKKLAGYTGLCPLVRQSGGKDRRGPLAKNCPTYLRWALIDRSVTGCQSVRRCDRDAPRPSCSSRQAHGRLPRSSAHRPPTSVSRGVSLGGCGSSRRSTISLPAAAARTASWGCRLPPRGCQSAAATGFTPRPRPVTAARPSALRSRNVSLSPPRTVRSALSKPLANVEPPLGMTDSPPQGTTV